MVYIIHTMCLVLTETREGEGAFGTVAVDGSDLPHGCWKRNLCPLEEQHMLPTLEPSLQSKLNSLKAVTENIKKSGLRKEQSPGLCRHQARTWCTNIHEGKIPTYINKK